MLGLDVSSSSVKLVELSRGSSGQFTLERCAMEPLERGWITDGNIEKFDEVAEGGAACRQEVRHTKHAMSRWHCRRRLSLPKRSFCPVGMSGAGA
jgi:Tfp pilus assembly PilM family ATPase